MKRHLRIIDFAVGTLRRNTGKTVVVVIVYSMLVAVVASLLLFVRALREESRNLLAGSPEIIVQTVRGGRHELTPVARAAAIGEIRGVISVSPRVWGYSYDPPTGATFTLWGADSVPSDALEFTAGELFDDDGQEGCYVGSGLAELRFLGIGDRLPMRRFDGTLFAPRVVGIFSTSSALLTNDLVVLPTGDLRRVFGIGEHECTDIAVGVHHPSEIAKVAAKIQEMWPDARAISRAQILRTYDAAFDWRGGLWAAILLGCVAAFVILVWDKATGLTEEEFRTIGLLKAIGWKSREIMELKLIEGSTISLVSLTTGFVLAQVHLLFFDGAIFARVLKGWSVLYPSHMIRAELDAATIVFCVALIAVPYAVASLIPSWRAAVTDPDTVLRS